MLPTAADLALDDAAAIAVARRPARLRRPKQPTLVAVVVESHRLDGQPRQRLVKYVGAIRYSDVVTLPGRRLFWARATKVLSEFDGPERVRMERTLEARVPHPTEEEITAAQPPLSDRTRDAFAAARARALAHATARATPTEDIKAEPARTSA